MTIQELEQQLLRLNRAERQRLSLLLSQSLITESSEPPTDDNQPTLAKAISQFRSNMSAEELDPNAEDIWQDVRDRTPIANEPRW